MTNCDALRRGSGGGGVFAGGLEMKIFSTIFRDFEKYDQETVFPTLDGASNYWKIIEKSRFEIIKNGISIFRYLSKKFLFSF